MEEASGPQVIEVWPDNWEAVGVFQAMGTQWRVGPGGPYGLDYGVLLGPGGVMSTLRVQRRQRLDIFEAIRIMENAALSTMHLSKGS